MRILAILLLFVFTVAGSVFFAHSGLKEDVESELRRKALEALDEAGYDDVEVSLDHLHGSLGGTVDHPDDVERVVALMRQEVPTARWGNPGEVEIGIRPTLPPRLRVSRAAGESRVKVEGTLASLEESGREMLGARLHALPGVAEVDNAIELDPMVLPFPKMAEFASATSSLLAHAGEAEAVLAEGKIALVGALPNDGLKKAVLDLAAQTGAAVDDQISVVAPVAFTRFAELKITRNRFGLTVSGIYPSEGDRKALLEIFREADALLSVTDRLEVRADCGPVSWQGKLPELIPAMLRTLGGEMTAEFNRTKIRVSGAAPDAESRDQLLALLTPLQEGEPGFEIVSDVEAGNSEAESLVAFSATYEGGLLTLTGKLPDPKLGQALEKALEGTLPEVHVKYEAETVVATASDGWTAGLPEFFADALSRISTGTIRYEDGVLELEGRTVALSDRQILQNLAVNTVPPHVEIQNRLLHADQPFPKPALLPEERTQLAEALKALPVYFDKNSEVLKEDEKPKVASIAEALKEAGGEVDLIVTGFSDNVGNSEQNKALSLRRATKVQSELIRLGVPEAALTLKSVEEDVSGTPRSQQWKSRRVEVAPEEPSEAAASTRF